MTSPVRKRRNQRKATELPEGAVIKAKPDLGPWDDLTVSDFALIKQAVRERWEVCEESRIRLVDAVVRTAIETKDDRLAISACQTVVMMADCDQADRHRAERDLWRQRFRKK